MKKKKTTTSKRKKWRKITNAPALPYRHLKPGYNYYWTGDPFGGDYHRQIFFSTDDVIYRACKKKLTKYEC